MITLTGLDNDIFEFDDDIVAKMFLAETHQSFITIYGDKDLPYTLEADRESKFMSLYDAEGTLLESVNCGQIVDNYVSDASEEYKKTI